MPAMTGLFSMVSPTCRRRGFFRPTVLFFLSKPGIDHQTDFVEQRPHGSYQVRSTTYSSPRYTTYMTQFTGAVMTSRLPRLTCGLARMMSV